ncbi:MAG: hypothetical protein CMJ90_11635 [Planctomycetes bacterium]|nr:hypothetical protein [Planctomycetota bacterium]
MKRFITALCLLSSVAISQGVALELSANPLAPGANLSVTLTESSGFFNLFFTTGCVFTRVVAGAPFGPIVANGINSFCPAVFTSVPPNGTHTQTWTAPIGMAPGLYYLKVVYWLGAAWPLGSPTIEWFPLTILDPNQPLLAAGNSAQVGQTLQLSVTHAASPGAPYVGAGSITTNQGFNPAPGIYCSLDMDAVFAISYTTPITSVFSGFQGTLNASGGADLFVHCPNIPALAHTPFHVQSAVFGTTGQVELTNPISFTIMP